ncbi:MAG: hypothetical protein RIC29_17910 [Rhodospirillaceae bacterium]
MAARSQIIRDRLLSILQSRQHDYSIEYSREQAKMIAKHDGWLSNSRRGVWAGMLALTEFRTSILVVGRAYLKKCSLSRVCPADHIDIVEEVIAHHVERIESIFITSINSGASYGHVSGHKKVFWNVTGQFKEHELPASLSELQRGFVDDELIYEHKPMILRVWETWLRSTILKVLVGVFLGVAGLYLAQNFKIGINNTIGIEERNGKSN